VACLLKENEETMAKRFFYSINGIKLEIKNDREIKEENRS
jgi:hypothetical protein